MNILVVDDEKNIAYAIAQILEEQKWQVFRHLRTDKKKKQYIK